MNKNVIGLYACVIYFVITFSQLHMIIPGLKYLKLGFLSSLVLLFLVLPELKKMEWYKPLGKWRLLFILAIIPGMFIGFATGKTRGVIFNSLQDFLVSFIAFSIFINSVNKLQLINKVLLLTSFLIGAYVLTHGGQGPGILIDENDVGLVLVMLLPFAYFSISIYPKKSTKIFLVGLVIFILLAIARTISRGAMVGALPTLVVIWLNTKHKIVTLLFLICLLFVTVAFGPPELINEFKSIKNTNEGTAGTRRYFWQLSIEMFKQRPIFGVGAGGWGHAVWSGLIYLPQHVGNSTPHSVYFQLLSELGIVGTFIWTMLIISTFRVAKRINTVIGIKLKEDTTEVSELVLLKTFSRSLTVGLFGGMVCGLFLSFLFYSYLYMYIGLLQTVFVLTYKKIEGLEMKHNTVSL